MAEGVEMESEEEFALGGGSGQQGPLGQERTHLSGSPVATAPRWRQPGPNGTLAQGCIKGTLSAPQPCRLRLCLAALPPSCTTEATPSPTVTRPSVCPEDLSSKAEPTQTPAATSKPASSSKPPLTPLESDSRISKEEFLRAQALREEGQAFPSLLVQLQGGQGG